VGIEEGLTWECQERQSERSLQPLQFPYFFISRCIPISNIFHYGGHFESIEAFLDLGLHTFYLDTGCVLNHGKRGEQAINEEGKLPRLHRVSAGNSIFDTE
jgi:hypothetical protein